jgi:hypothetical protein
LLIELIVLISQPFSFFFFPPSFLSILAELAQLNSSPLQSSQIVFNATSGVLSFRSLGASMNSAFTLCWQ